MPSYLFLPYGRISSILLVSMMVKKITCQCGYVFEEGVAPFIDIDSMPEIIEQITTGAFLSYICPSCAAKISIELQTEFVWKSRGTTLLFVPETKRIACLALCAGTTLIDPETNKKVPNHFLKKHQMPVIGYPELADRVAVLAASLDPLIIEAVKFFILTSKKDTHKGKLTILFESLTDDEKLEFHIHGMREHEVAVLTVPLSFYYTVDSDYRQGKHREVFSALRLGQYLSYKNIAVEEDDHG